MNTTAQLVKLRKDRQLVRFFVVIGVAASLGANAIDSVTALNAAVAMWPPIALLSVLEILPRIPVGRWYSTLGRVAATLAVAGAAAWLSYSHMASVAAAHGEAGVNSSIWPISVDGLMTVAAIALVEIGARIRMLESTPEVASAPAIAPPTAFEVDYPVEAVTSPTLPVAPVSPAPAGRMRPGALGLMVEKPMPPITYRTARSMPIRSVLSKEGSAA